MRTLPLTNFNENLQLQLGRCQLFLTQIPLLETPHLHTPFPYKFFIHMDRKQLQQTTANDYDSDEDAWYWSYVYHMEALREAANSSPEPQPHDFYGPKRFDPYDVDGTRRRYCLERVIQKLLKPYEEPYSVDEKEDIMGYTFFLLEDTTPRHTNEIFEYLFLRYQELRHLHFTKNPMSLDTLLHLALIPEPKNSGQSLAFETHHDGSVRFDRPVILIGSLVEYHPYPENRAKHRYGFVIQKFQGDEIYVIATQVHMRDSYKLETCLRSFLTVIKLYFTSYPDTPQDSRPKPGFG